jgi:CheY-like chemotaxis protein
MQALSGGHVLLVEDHADSRDIMKVVMEYQGALVVPVPDAKSALAAMRTLKPDVLVTDISMPEEDGIALIREAREEGILEGVPTLAVSAFSPNDNRAREEGVAAVIRTVPGSASCSMRAARFVVWPTAV